MFGHETNAGCGARSGSRSVRCGREAPHGVLQTAVNTEINLKSEVDTREGRVLETLNWAGLGLVRPGNRHTNLRGARLSWAKTKHGGLLETAAVCPDNETIKPPIYTDVRLVRNRSNDVTRA